MCPWLWRCLDLLGPREEIAEINGLSRISRTRAKHPRRRARRRGPTPGPAPSARWAWCRSSCTGLALQKGRRTMKRILWLAMIGLSVASLTAAKEPTPAAAEAGMPAGLAERTAAYGAA